MFWCSGCQQFCDEKLEGIQIIDKKIICDECAKIEHPELVKKNILLFIKNNCCKLFSNAFDYIKKILTK